MLYQITSKEPRTAAEVAAMLYSKYEGPKTGVSGTRDQEWGVCLCFDGYEGRYLWGVKPIGRKTKSRGDTLARRFELTDITLNKEEMPYLRSAIRKARDALSCN